MNKSIDCIVKGVIIGDKKAGKTNFLKRLCQDYFSGTYQQTIGIEFYSKDTQVSQTLIRVQFWDTQTSQKSQSQQIKQLLSRGCILMIFLYSITDGQSFEFIQKKLYQYNKILSKQVIKVLIGNKTDLQQNRKVDKKKGEQLTLQYNGLFGQVSAKDSSGVRQIFYRIRSEMNRTIQQYDN